MTINLSTNRLEADIKDTGHHHRLTSIKDHNHMKTLQRDIRLTQEKDINLLCHEVAQNHLISGHFITRRICIERRILNQLEIDHLI